jgi:hypothetical protein
MYVHELLMRNVNASCSFTCVSDNSLGAFQKIIMMYSNLNNVVAMILHGTRRSTIRVEADNTL